MNAVATVTKRNDKAVKISRDLAVKAKVIAETRGISIAEYLTDLLRPMVERDWPKALKKIDQSKYEPSQENE